MKGFFFITVLCFAITGCANINPKNNSPINNPNGKIDEIRNNQNGVTAEIGKIRQALELQNSQMKEMQNGLLNLNVALSRNENSGVQILQGDGSLILIFALVVIGMILYWYRDRAVKSEKIADLMAKEVATFNNANLNDNILKAAIYNETESHVFNLLTKYSKN